MVGIEGFRVSLDEALLFREATV
ncbi:ribosomal-protein-alanine N-acetyltransferase, partial [Listeria monocytogenes]|nr:ribosomal-protein-alanine N-acetyltransferase [Listeria monocytogenes]